MAPLAAGHEFWLAPHQYRVAQGEQVAAAVRVGQMFRGAELPYISTGFSELSVRTPNGTQRVSGFEGDIPAVTYTAKNPGLNVIRYHSSANTVSYNSWDEFLGYLAYEGLSQYAQMHQARGLPLENFDESYIRFAKSLVQVGRVADADADLPSGAPLELVAESNPYQAGIEQLPIRLLRENEPVAHRQLAVFRYDGAVTRSLMETDANGRASIPVAQGGTYLVSATDLQPLNDAVENGPVWQSYWASLTFGLPIASASHPMDPLTNIEIVRVIQIIGRSGKADAATRVALVTLDEPDKRAVFGWREGETFSRRAVAVVRNGADAFEAVIDLHAEELIQWQALPGIQPALSSEEWSVASRLTKADPRWLAAMRARGYDDVANIFCEGLPAGYFGAKPAEPRLLKMACYDVEGARSHIYGRPIEGVISAVDLDAGKVVSIVDTGVVPVSRQSHEFVMDADPPDAEAAQTPEVSAGFRLDGRSVQWRDWSFHVGFDQRFGTVISLVRHKDGQRKRLVLYQGYVSEVFVPYMDADEGWYFRTPMDVGEYGLGMLASPLSPGIDCPSGATYLDASVSRPNGSIYLKPGAICIFERGLDAPLWRHREALNGVYAGRKAAELVARFIPAIGNYDYIVDWVFTEKGEIEVNIGATGIDAVKGTAAGNAQEFDEPGERADGMLIAPHLVAVHHDHYFSVRLDMDVDGPVNNFVRERLQIKEVSEANRSIWQPQRLPFDREGGFSARSGPELWRVESTGTLSSLGHHPSYQIVGTGVTSMLAGKDWPHRRAAFAGETLWVTQRKPGELFAGGAYPNQSGAEDGLPAYVNGEAVQQADVVAWYTIGFNHLTRPEDWPVLPTIWHGMKLRPYGFFERNPSTGKGSSR